MTAADSVPTGKYGEKVDYLVIRSSRKTSTVMVRSICFSNLSNRLFGDFSVS